ncbi:MAG: HU family DNA-binding protein [Clostridia bacterium]|nr:HU family DNA-binding protein [Clostridia bacterium]
MSMKWFPVYMKNRQKWFPKSVSHSRAVTTEQLCRDIAQSSTVAPGDVAAVLRTLSDAMVKYLADGRPVKLDNIGTFRLVASASGNGVNTEEEVTTDQFNKMMVRFLPEKVSTLGGIKSQNIPVLANTEIQWERTEPKKSKGSSATGSGSGSGTGSGSGGTTPGGDSGSGEGDEG